MLHINCMHVHDSSFFFSKRNLDYLIIKPYALKPKGAFGSKIYLVVHV